jgi:CRISPR type III-associated protein (TIGR04423 family)
MGGNKMILNDINEVKNYVEKFHNASGYCKDLSNKNFIVFENEKVKISEFPYEIVFKNNDKSVIIRYINNRWYVDETDLKNLDIKENDILEFLSVNEVDKNIVLVQIWEEYELYEGLRTKRIKKVIFYGFKEKK